MSSSLVKAVIAYWDAHDVWYLPGLGDDDIAMFEQAYGVKVPDDMACFYRTTNGTRAPRSTGADHDLYDFYRLSEVVPDSTYPWALTFADYCLLSWWYAIDLTGASEFGRGTVYMLGAIGGDPRAVARSFDEFLDVYVRGDDRMWQDGALAYHQALRRDVFAQFHSQENFGMVGGGSENQLG
jgi:hypothetical protein